MNRRILLLEDDFDTNEIITMIFEPEGFEVLASSVGTYLHDIEKWNPELIIVDHLLNSATTGSDTCIALKANAKTAHIPFILRRPLITCRKLPKNVVQTNLSRNPSTLTTSFLLFGVYCQRDHRLLLSIARPSLSISSFL